MEPLTQTHHVFVDFENVHEVDLDAIRHESVIFNLLIGPQKRKLDTDLVEVLVHHAASVNLVRMSSSGRNALDFALAYYLGRACVSDPRGAFYLVSKDTGYDPLLVHLRANNINAQRHNDFSTLPFLSHAKPKAKPAAVPAPKAKAPARSRAVKTTSVPKVSAAPVPVPVKAPLTSKPHPAPKAHTSPPPASAAKPHPKPAKAAPAASPAEPEDTLTVLALNRLVLNEPHNPKTINRLKSYLKGQLGAKVSEKDADLIIRELTENGIIELDGSGKVTYHLDPFSEDAPPF